MNLKGILGVIGGLILLIGTCFGIYFFFESRYALAEELEKTKARLEYKIQEDRMNALRERIWRVEDRLEDSGRRATEIEKEELRKLKAEKEKIESGLKK